VGCLYCQKACPVNKDIFPSIEEGPVFSETETEFISQGFSHSKEYQNAIQKLKSLDMIEYLPFLGRNLKALQNQLPPA
jgi:hypothetical protein